MSFIIDPVIISIFALFISTAALVVGVLNYRRDRGKLSVTLSFHVTSPSGTGFNAILVNAGRRVIIINNIFLLTKNKERIPPYTFTKLPITLSEAESATVDFPLFNYKPILPSPLNIKKGIIVNSQGKEHKVSMRKILPKMRRQWTKEEQEEWLKPREQQ